jgi:phosphatidylglycerophosphate synthase
MSLAAAALGSLLPALALIATFLIYAARAWRGGHAADPDAVSRGGRRVLGLFLRDYWYWLHGPAERLALRRGVHPDALTVGGLLLNACAGISFAVGWFALAGWLIVLAGSTDVLDGRVARKSGRASPAGAFLDSTLDRYGDWALLAGLAVFFRNHWGLYAALLAMGGSFLVSYTRARAEGLGRTSSEGLFQRAERLLFLAAGGILTPLIAWAFGIAYATPMLVILVILAVLSNWTALERLRGVYRALEERPLPR